MSRSQSASLLQLLGVDHERIDSIIDILKDYLDARERAVVMRQSLKMMGTSPALLDDQLREIQQYIEHRIAGIDSLDYITWEIARDEVLSAFPSAICQMIGTGGGWRIKKSVSGDSIGAAKTQAGAWLNAANLVRQFPPVDRPIDADPLSPHVPVWSREIPTESGWYWWRRDARMLPQFCRVDELTQFLTIGPLSGSRSESMVGYRGNPEYYSSEFGPRIIEPVG